ncbi:Cof-type HAD-IIB family hydrolase [bacterium]|nr:Cof-type HAD-IIB family hydrolase [bacterium]
MLAVDLDGTLFNSKSKISSENKKAIARCCNTGVKVVITSAKPCLIVCKLAKMLNLTVPQVSYSGALIMEGCLKTIFKLTIPSEISREVIQCCREWKKGLTIGADDGFLYYEYKHPYLKIITDTGDKIVKTQNLESEEITGRAIMFSISGYENDGFEEYLKNRIKSKSVKIVRGSPHSILVLNSEADKFLAVRKIMDIYNIKKDELLAIGDSNNDLEIVKFAGIGVAMGNSVKDLKKVADYIVPDNDRNGFAFAVNNYVLNRGLIEEK